MDWNKLLESVGSFLERKLTRFFERHPIAALFIPPAVAYFSKPDPPAPPDYAGAARSQGGANLQSTIAGNILNNPTQVTPYGTQSRTQTGTYTIPGAEGNAPVDIPTFTSNIDLTPEGQKLFDQNNRISSAVGDFGEAQLGRVGQSVAQPFGLGGVDAIQNKAEEALLARINPQLDRDREALRTQLINQGFRAGTEGYDQGMKRADQQANDARTQAVVSALQTRPQSLQEDLAIRNQPLNELNAFRSGSQVTLPQFQGSGNANVAPAPVFNAAGQQGAAATGLYNADAAQSASTTGGLFGLGGAALMAYAM